MSRTILHFLLPFLVYSYASGEGYRLSGTIRGLSDTTVYLQQIVDIQYVTIDSARTDMGKFELSGTAVIPDLYFLRIAGKRGRCMFFLENSPVSISVHADSLNRPRITGSKVQDEFLAYQAGIDAIHDRMNVLGKEYREAVSSGNTTIANELENQIEALYDGIEQTQIRYIEKNPSSYIAPYIIQSVHYGKEADEIEKLLAKLNPSLQSSVLVGNIQRTVETLKAVAVGMMAPDFTQPDPEGNPLQLSSLRGNYLLIDFWAAWCGPCRRENPNVVEAYQKYHDRGFDVLGVSLDRSRDRWLQAIRDDNLTWNHVSDLQYWSNGAARLYGINSIPSNLLLDPEGRIIAKNIRGKELHAELAKHLGY